MCGVVIGVTSGGCWLDGYWWWVCPSGQSTAAQKFALWCLYGSGSGSLVANSTVTSGTLTAGQWNYVPLPTPLPLAIGATYVAATGFTGSFPGTNNQFGSGDPYSGGIVSGPLTAYSDASGSTPVAVQDSSGRVQRRRHRPDANLPIYGSSSSNFWMDVLVDTTPPAGTSYRLWPSYPTIPGHIDSDTTGYTLATEFQLSKSCTLDNIWYYSAPGAAALPTRCAIWNVSSQSVVSGTDNTRPPGRERPGPAGWRALTAVSRFPPATTRWRCSTAGGSEWYQATNGYWATGGPGAGGITAGPVTAPGTSAATSPGQSTYNFASWAYPQTYAAAGDGENYWVDVEVTPTS